MMDDFPKHYCINSSTAQIRPKFPLSNHKCPFRRKPFHYLSKIASNCVVWKRFILVVNLTI